MTDEQDPIDLDTVDDYTEQSFQQIMELNQAMQERAARRARKLYKVAEQHDMFAERCRDLAAVQVMTAQQLSEVAADILTAEFDITIIHEDADEEYDDSEIEEEDE